MQIKVNRSEIQIKQKIEEPKPTEVKYKLNKRGRIKITKILKIEQHLQKRIMFKIKGIVI